MVKIGVLLIYRKPGYRFWTILYIKSNRDLPYFGELWGQSFSGCWRVSLVR